MFRQAKILLWVPLVTVSTSVDADGSSLRTYTSRYQRLSLRIKAAIFRTHWKTWEVGSGKCPRDLSLKGEAVESLKPLSSLPSLPLASEHFLRAMKSNIKFWGGHQLFTKVNMSSCLCTQKHCTNVIVQQLSNMCIVLVTKAAQNLISVLFLCHRLLLRQPNLLGPWSPF